MTDILSDIPFSPEDEGRLRAMPLVLHPDELDLIRRYWPSTADALPLVITDLRTAVQALTYVYDARGKVAMEAMVAQGLDAWRKGAAPRPEYTGIESGATPYVERYTALADRTQAIPMAQWPGLGEPVYEAPSEPDTPAPTPRRKPGTAAVVVMIAMAAALLCCGAAASEGIRWLTEGIQ
jgi:hypothetical protein